MQYLQPRQIYLHRIIQIVFGWKNFPMHSIHNHDDTSHIEVILRAWRPYIIFCHIYGYPRFINVANNMIAFVLLKGIIYHERQKYMSSIKQVIFACIILLLFLLLELPNTKSMFLTHIGVVLALQSVIPIYRHENLLLDTCLCHPDYNIDPVWKYLESWHNTTTHISSESKDVDLMYSYTWFPCIWMFLFCVYDNHG